ncbi:MAG: reverse transcriptase domain-containing protein, partial [Pseudomonadota bacterium]
RTPLAGEGMMLNVVARGEHVPEIERHVRTLKERCRAVYNSLPYRRMPKRMVIELVYAMTFWLHAFPARDGVSETVSPRELVTGIVLDANKHCRIPFGAYAQTHEEHDNTMASRTVGAIALRPTGNAQGGYLFYSLQSGRCINRNHWTEVPMPVDAIARVEQMAESKGLNVLEFGDRHNNPRPDDDATEVQSISSGSDKSSDDEGEGAGAANDGDGDYDGDDNGHDEPDDDDANQGEVDCAPRDEPGEPGTDQHDAGQFADEHASLPPPRMPEQGQAGFKPEPTLIVPREASDEESEWADAADGAEEEVDGHAYDTLQPEQTAEHGHGEGADGTEASPQGSPEVVADRAGVAAGDVEAATEEDGKPGQSHDDIGTPGVLPTDATGAEKAREADGAREAGSGFTRSQDVRSSRRGLRPLRKLKKPTRYQDGAVLFNDDKATIAQDTEPIAPQFGPSQLSGFGNTITPLTTVLLTQYGMKKGLRAFGKPADDAIRTEMVQLHELNVMTPRAPATITRSERRSALQYLMFLKQKRSGAIKGRGCADGRKQRGEMTKPEASSPTVSTEAVFLLLTIAAKERRDVMVIDIPGAFLQTNLDPSEQVLIRFDGRMAELLALIDPQVYRPSIVTEGGKPVIYAQLKKALYGMLQSALRFWEQVLDDITGLGFEVNPYDWCVANRMVNGNQQTICWHVDDFLISHVDNSVNEELVAWFSKKYGKRLALSIHRGKEHEYLGMDINLKNEGKVEITMCDFIEKLLAEAPEEFTGTAATPAANHLFETDPEQTKLREREAGIFHHLVAKMLYLSKRARPDLQLAVAFLCTRVSAPDTDDWKKLGRAVAYLRGSPKLPLTLEADDSRVVKWWVDAAFAVTHDMRSQSGGTMTLGKGSVTSSSTRQRINTRSSTEAELVGASDFLPQVLWTRYFLNEQGYGVRENILHQDNQSAMMLEHNGRASSGKRTRHINIRYYFISDRIAAGEVCVKYCPTAEMLGDFFTKPLQGASFKRFRKEILNLQDDY